MNIIGDRSEVKLASSNSIYDRNLNIVLYEDSDAKDGKEFIIQSFKVGEVVEIRDYLDGYLEMLSDDSFN